MVRKKSVVWCFFRRVDEESVQCLLCLGRVKHGQGQGTTTNLLRHLRVKHPATEIKKIPEAVHEDMETDGEHFCSVEVALEDGDAETHTTGNDADINSAIDSILEAAQEGPAEQTTHEEANDNRPVIRRQKKRSMIWRHFEVLDSLEAARCRICMKKLQCFEGGSTSNLHRHMSKRHPEMFSRLGVDRQTPPPCNSNANGDTLKPPKTVGSTEIGALKLPNASTGAKSALRRERELIEALRRAQKEEARALDHQRELLEKLRAVDAREAAAEREKIESLRKAQLEEANDLSRQREELQREKEALQKKMEEFHRERQEVSRGQQAPDPDTICE
ncbi:hypothetical protein D9C73_004173 [Collichthys lucidus]|uniref:BED-type domain-containing protein n=1 Tax=Collichthys lucidus TaxID=240159 RepID=A0A4U5U734_COLLU|nr:hypothetical protein D9C73_004173 [Collichthys lucidus]